jgi:hypothetical protein
LTVTTCVALPTVTATGKRTARTGGFVVACACVERGVGVGRAVVVVGVGDVGGVVATVICAWGEPIPREASSDDPPQPATGITSSATTAGTTARTCVLPVVIGGQRLKGTDG